jgi:uncharacterized membrane protein HdeD (DUF308 family)
MERTLSSDVHSATTWSIVLSILMIVAGVLAIASPLMAGVVVTALVGWLLIFSAGLHLVYAFRGGRASAIMWEVLLAIVYGVAGFYLLANPGVGLVTLTFVIAFYLFVEGILELALSYQMRSESGAGWLLFDGIVTLILAAMIWSNWPSSSVWAVGVLVGVSMFFSGITRLMLSYSVRKIVA